VRTAPFAPAALIAALVVTCACSATAAPAHPRRLVDFARTGGLASGLQLRVTVMGNGQATIVGGRRDRTTHRRLRAGTMRHLRRVLAAARFDRVPRFHAGCLDCFVFSVRYKGVRAAWKQGPGVPRSVQVAVAALMRIAGSR
jgi:hypothetical protein